MTARAARNLGLTAHVVTSLGWLGAVAAFMVLAVAGLVSPDAALVRGAYLAMGLVSSFMIVPLCLATLLSGVVQSLLTKWGLFEHYWVVIKLLVTVLATLVLFMHLRPIEEVALAAARGALTSSALAATRLQIAVDAAAAILVLLVATALGVYKPRGLTPYGWRRQRRAEAARAPGAPAGR